MAYAQDHQLLEQQFLSSPTSEQYQMKVNYKLPSNRKDSRNFFSHLIRHTLNVPITTERRVASEAAANPAVLRQKCILL